MAELTYYIAGMGVALAVAIGWSILKNLHPKLPTSNELRTWDEYISSSEAEIEAARLLRMRVLIYKHGSVANMPPATRDLYLWLAHGGTEDLWTEFTEERQEKLK